MMLIGFRNGVAVAAGSGEKTSVDVGMLVRTVVAVATIGVDLF